MTERTQGDKSTMKKLPSAKIVDLRTVLEPQPTITTAGPVIWATVEIIYASNTADPSVLIRVPLPWSKSDTEEERKSIALRFARQLIDHACVAMPPGPTLEETTALEGLTQELGLSDPTTNPRQKKPD